MTNEGDNWGTHDWSGWPGAWCLDCGIEDPMELALADGDFDLIGEGNIAKINFICLPCHRKGEGLRNPYILRKTDPSVLAKELIGVQPMEDWSAEYEVVRKHYKENR